MNVPKGNWDGLIERWNQREFLGPCPFQSDHEHAQRARPRKDADSVLVCVRLSPWHTEERQKARSTRSRACTRAHVRAHTHVRTHTHTRIHIHTNKRTHAHTRRHAKMHAHTKWHPPTITLYYLLLVEEDGGICTNQYPYIHFVPSPYLDADTNLRHKPSIFTSWNKKFIEHSGIIPPPPLKHRCLFFVVSFFLKKLSWSLAGAH